MAKRWFKLDNAAKLYPAVSTARWSSSFRVSAVLTEDVDPERLQKALNRVMNRFPALKVRMRAGLFWYYLEEIREPLAVRPDDCDGLITDRPGVPLCVFSADCVPVLLSEPERGIVCAVHSGWKGTVKDMMGAAVRAVTAMGGKAENIRAAIGPAISRCCFEVGPEVREAVEALMGAEAGELCPPEEGVPGKFMADLKEINRRRLAAMGVRPEHIDVSADCTKCMSDVYWSHRATKGRRGTMASIIML